MGLLDRLSGVKKQESLSPKAALALAAMTVIGADGSVDEEELSNLQRIVKGDNEAFEQAYEAYKRLDVTDSISLVAKTLNEKQRLATIANLLDIAMADGMMAGAEQRVLNIYLESFKIAEDKISPLVEFVALKNDISVFEK